MPAASSSSNSPRPDRVLVIGESAEAAYRYASSDGTDVELVVGQDGAAAPHGEAYDQVIVAGFAGTPDTLRTVVDRGFELAGPDGHVLVGSGAGPIADDVAAWDAAFAGLSVAAVDRGTFPAVELVRTANGSAGTFLAGALTVLGLVDPRPDLKKVPQPTAVGAAPAKSAKPKARPRPSRKQALIVMVRRRSKFLILAAAGGVVALAVSVGLVALLDEYFLAILVTITLLAVMVTTLRQEQYNRQIGRQLGRVESAQSGFRKKVSERMRQQGKEITQIQKNVGITQLAVADAAKTLQAMQVGFKDREKPDSAPGGQPRG